MTKKFKPKQHIQRLFIANRGEIASRIVKTARKLGIRTIGLTTEIDSWSDADEKAFLSGESLNDTYLNIDAIVNLASAYNADAIHPGYGFLSENPNFAKATEEAGIIFVGPSHHAIHKMGNKINAREIARKLNIPTPVSIHGNKEEILEKSNTLPYPILVKAAAGGGGKGMYKINHPEELQSVLDRAEREASNYFGDSSVYAEQYIEEPRHIEVQVLGDHHGNFLHLFERECSIQRRYQKIIEEAPSPFVDDELREKLTADAIKLCKEIGYYNAGTIEFLVDKNRQHFFLEMNTRIQVEHPVTELITNIDLIEQQIKIAEGWPLAFNQNEISFNGHAIECRIYAENVNNNFSPTPGYIYQVQWPESDLARTDTWIHHPTEIKPDFDPMVAKIITHGKNRAESIRKQINALNNVSITGITNNIHFLAEIMKSESFILGNTNTGFCNSFKYIAPPPCNEKQTAAAALACILNQPKSNNQPIWHQTGYYRVQQQFAFSMNQQMFQIQWQKKGELISIQTNGQTNIDISNEKYENHEIIFSADGTLIQFKVVKLPNGSFILQNRTQQLHIIPSWILPDRSQMIQSQTNGMANGNSLKAPIPGKIIEIKVKEGENIRMGQTLVTLEAMKTENQLTAKHNGIINKVYAVTGKQVKANDVLLDFE